MAYTQEQLDKLDEAISQGVTRVKYADKEVEYRSLSDMRQIRDLIKQELGLNTGLRRVKVEYSKGL